MAQIWSMHFSGAGRRAIAIEHKLAVIVVDFALRRYQRILDGMMTPGRALLMATRAVTPQVRDYLRKAEYRFQNVLRRASERAVESNKTCRAWERMMGDTYRIMRRSGTRRLALTMKWSSLTRNDELAETQ